MNGVPCPSCAGMFGQHAGNCSRRDSYSVLTPVMIERDATVHAPPHYRQGAIECIDAIRAALTPEEFRGYCKGNVMKYIWREKMKGKDEDMKKAAAYLKYANASTAGPSSDAPATGALGAVERT